VFRVVAFVLSLTGNLMSAAGKRIAFAPTPPRPVALHVISTIHTIDLHFRNTLSTNMADPEPSKASAPSPALEEDTGTWKKSQSRFSKYANHSHNPLPIRTMSSLYTPANATVNTLILAKKQQTAA
jgi:hypothetical protein